MKLKPCPFCGSDRVYYTEAESKLFVPFVEVATAIFDAPTIIEAEEGET